jgi:hypothetical protein
MILLSFKSLAKNYYLYISWGGYLFFAKEITFYNYILPFKTETNPPSKPLYVPTHYSTYF